MIDLRLLVGRLQVLDCVALVPRVSSTNDVARRVVEECIENEIPAPSAVIVAGQQLAGRGRNSRTWFSPPGKGIYVTAIHTRPAADLAFIPLMIGVTVATFLRETFAIQAGLKWPNDVLVDGKKIAGILIEARIREDEALLLIGIGINVQGLGDGAPDNTASIEQSSPREVTLESAVEAFIEHLDAALARPIDGEGTLEAWRRLSVHRSGDRVECQLADRKVSGTWGGLDQSGRALIRSGHETIAVSAGDIVLV
jgi:BirA family biotin operon repressor/biotin-[acetyl-CoA-carboxylase] ligase